VFDLVGENKDKSSVYVMWERARLVVWVGVKMEWNLRRKWSCGFS